MADSPADYIRQSMAGLQDQTEAHRQAWHFGEETNWSVDQKLGLITFTFADGAMASAPVQIVGTRSVGAGTFMWGWDHPSVMAPLRKHAVRAREWGEQQGVPEFTSRLVQANEQQAWEFTAVAARLSGANGAYRGPAGDVQVFMTFGEITLQAAPEAGAQTTPRQR